MGDVIAAFMVGIGLAVIFFVIRNNTKGKRGGSRDEPGRNDEY